MEASLMTTMQTTAAVDVGAAIITKARSLSLDRTRTFLTLVVLLHHAVIPYTYFGHTDPKSFFGFDMIVLATDSSSWRCSSSCRDCSPGRASPARAR